MQGRSIAFHHIMTSASVNVDINERRRKHGTRKIEVLAMLWNFAARA